jgi:hypothetical protein
MDVRLFVINREFLMKTNIDEAVASILELYPKEMPGYELIMSSNLPLGWRALVDEFIRYICAVCSPHQLKAFTFSSIDSSPSGIFLEFDFSCEVACDLNDRINAKYLAIRNRSAFSCITCGSLVDSVEDLDPWPVCKAHKKQSSDS